jgi:phage repressor protein C with HTH and peptisase S24 domain
MSDYEAKEFSLRLNDALDLRSYPSFGRGRINYVQEIFEISRAGANKWLHGKAIPHAKKRVEIARKLGVNLKWLETGVGSPHDKDETLFQFSNTIAHEIPLINMRQAYQDVNELDKSTIEQLVVTHTTPQNAIAIKNASSAMEPKLPMGAILIVETNAILSDGDYVVAKTALLPEVLIRQFIQGAENNYLVAINSKFEPIIMDKKNVTVIGKIIEVRNTL